MCACEFMCSKALVPDKTLHSNTNGTWLEKNVSASGAKGVFKYRRRSPLLGEGTPWVRFKSPATHGRYILHTLLYSREKGQSQRGYAGYPPLMGVHGQPKHHKGMPRPPKSTFMELQGQALLGRAPEERQSGHLNHSGRRVIILIITVITTRDLVVVGHGKSRLARRHNSFACHWKQNRCGPQRDVKQKVTYSQSNWF